MCWTLACNSRPHLLVYDTVDDLVIGIDGVIVAVYELPAKSGNRSCIGRSTLDSGNDTISNG